jgi:hypothetical protein
MQHLITIKEKLFDGPDEKYYAFSHHFHTPQEVVIYERDFRKNYFDGLESLMNSTDFSQLLKEGKFQKPAGQFDDYSGSDGLALNYFINQDLLYVFATGEYQPARFKIYCEGVWKLR